MNLFSEKKFISAKTGKGLKYLYYSPNTDGNLPLIIYLHGAGSRGTELFAAVARGTDRRA